MRPILLPPGRSEAHRMGAPGKVLSPAPVEAVMAHHRHTVRHTHGRSVVLVAPHLP
jgi:hypothetical protein